jgi:hypothetical protein
LFLSHARRSDSADSLHDLRRVTSIADSPSIKRRLLNPLHHHDAAEAGATCRTGIAERGAAAMRQRAGVLDGEQLANLAVAGSKCPHATSGTTRWPSEPQVSAPALPPKMNATNRASLRNNINRGRNWNRPC